MLSKLKKVNEFAYNYKTSFICILSGLIILIFSAIFHGHSLWQLDLICVGPVWSYPPLTNLGYAWIIPQVPWSVTRYADQYFQDGPIYVGTIGGGYDFFLGLNTFCWALAIAGTFLIMFGVMMFYRTKLKRLVRKINETS